MNPVTVIFDLQRLLWSILAFLIWSLLTFGAGYLYKGHRDSVADAAVGTKQVAVTTTVKAAATTIDTTAVDRLKGQLANANARAATLQQIIKGQSDATPAAPTCRLTDGLREQINADLAAGSR